jgi:hypothetical protein
MIIHREIGPSYHHKPIVQGVNYSPLMVESKEETSVKEERWPEAILASGSPSNLPLVTCSASISCFCYSMPLFSGTPRGAFL